MATSASAPRYAAKEEAPGLSPAGLLLLDGGDVVAGRVAAGDSSAG